jgi:dTDP-4-amino-4,6-dideoxygalactose transaminase
MKADGITTPFHYVPLHNSPAGLRPARTSGRMTHSEDLSVRLIRLPLYPQMGDVTGYHFIFISFFENGRKLLNADASRCF